VAVHGTRTIRSYHGIRAIINLKRGGGYVDGGPFLRGMGCSLVLMERTSSARVGRG